MDDAYPIVGTAWTWLEDALTNIDGDVLLTSPYLSPDVCSLLAAAADNSDHQFVLITTLDASATANGYLPVEGGLQLLLNAGIQLRHTERLHAKCFIIGARGFLGSANLTGAGLGKSTRANRELGIVLNPTQVTDARERILSWPAVVVSQIDLDNLRDSAQKLTRTRKDQIPSDAVSALQLAEELLADARERGRKLWVKLEYGEPALDGWRRESWFASPKKGKPGFRPRDLVLICAKDTHDCYAVVEVTTDPEYQPDDYVAWADANDIGADERWPWINRTRPRFVPDQLMQLKLNEVGVSGRGLQNGHVRLQLDRFAVGVRALARLATGA